LPISIIISTTGLSESNKPAACQLLLGLSLNQVDEHYQMKNMTKPMAIVVSPLLTPLYPFTMIVMVKKITSTLKK
jgi:hypothetical protein